MCPHSPLLARSARCGAAVSPKSRRCAALRGRQASLAALALALPLASIACASNDARGTTPVPLASSSPAASTSSSRPADFPDEPRRLSHFHSKRFSLTIPFPDGKAWRIDDHTADELIATHAATSSKLVVSILADPDELMTRQKCEARARAHKPALVTDAAMRTVADERTYAMESFDTRVWVAIEAPATPAQPLTGHVFAFGGYIHKCFFFHYATSVANVNGEDVLSSRLATARLRMLGEMKVDELAEVPRQKPNLER